MPRVVTVCFRRAGRPYRFDAGDLDLHPGHRVVVKTSRGLELGTVRSQPADMPEADIEGELKPILREATDDDLHKDDLSIERERDAMRIAGQKIAEHGLPMKPIEAEATLDRSRIVIHFGAEGRVDFRTLVRDLARALRTRVELHQVGVRDEAKMRGGLGHCGRPLCCTTFLTHFDPVGIKAAKEQDITLNPQKISGVCGRLMCCLNFEYAHYREARQCLPKTGSRIETEQGPGKVTEVNVLRNRVVISLDEGGHIELPTAAVARHQPGCPHLSGSATASPPGPHLSDPPTTSSPDPHLSDPPTASSPGPHPSDPPTASSPDPHLSGSQTASSPDKKEDDRQRESPPRRRRRSRRRRPRRTQEP